MIQKQKALVAILVIVLVAGFLYASFTYKTNLIGKVIEDNCKIKSFNVSDTNECKAKCLIIDIEEFNYKPKEGYGICTCLKELC